MQINLPSPVDTPPQIPPAQRSANAKLPFGVWTAGLASRTLLIVILAVATVRVASPQSETIWSAYETPGDLIRLLVGFALCVWLIVHAFILPKDADGYWTWIYLAPVAGLALLCTIVIW